MKNLSTKLVSVFALFVVGAAYIFPWTHLGLSDPFAGFGSYKLGLDLHGGVELDYKVDTDEAQRRARSASGSVYNEQSIIDGMKRIIEKRVNAIGTAEPTIQSARYGSEQHIIVQIPTQTFSQDGLTDEDIARKNAEFVAQAKSTIGRVVRLEFKERKNDITDADRKERETIAQALEAESKTTEFGVLAQKFQGLHERIGYITASGELSEITLPWSATALTGAKVGDILPLVKTSLPGSAEFVSGAVQEIPGETGYALVKVTDIRQEKRDLLDASGAVLSGQTRDATVYVYQGIFVSEQPSEWTAAKTADGKVLDERYLLNANVQFSDGFTPQVGLTFNEEGKKLFAELTQRLLGKEIAIFVGGELLTAPVVQAVITDGLAVITGQYTPDEAKKLADDINTGIVPAPIYLTSERTIDAKIGAHALEEIIVAGLIGLLLIIVFLTVVYRVSGLLAGVALVIYGILLVALVKIFGIVLTLASIAGIILSIGLAIDANILIFERTREELMKKQDILTAIRLGFERSWSAIWDSHITSFTSAVVLYLFGINLIKGFGLMLGLGILLSLFTAMWVSRVLVWWIGEKMSDNLGLFIGLKK